MVVLDLEVINVLDDSKWLVAEITLTGAGKMQYLELSEPRATCVFLCIPFTTWNQSCELMEHWDRLPRGVLEAPSLEILKSCLDVILGTQL